MLHKNTGFTAVEVIVAISIVLLLAALSYPSFVAGKEKSRQVACMSQLKQIYAALQLYEAEFQPNDPLSTAISVPSHALTHPGLLLRYIRDRRVFFCPEVPECAKVRIFSNYQWNGISERLRKFDPDQAEVFQDKIDTEGLAYPIVTCWAHDEMFYRPGEPDVDPALRTPFVVDLHADGSTTARRRPGPTVRDLAVECNDRVK